MHKHNRRTERVHAAVEISLALDVRGDHFMGSLLMFVG